MKSVPGQTDSAVDWELVLRDHDQWLRAMATARIDDRAAAEDIVQETLLSAVRHVAPPTDPKRIRPWLYRILVRRVADHLRRRYAKSKHEHQYAEDRSESAEDSWQALIAFEEKSRIGTAMERLDKNSRQVLVEKFVRGRSYDQIAQTMNCTPRSVEYQLVKAKQRLRELLQDPADD